MRTAPGAVPLLKPPTRPTGGGERSWEGGWRQRGGPQEPLSDSGTGQRPCGQAGLASGENGFVLTLKMQLSFSKEKRHSIILKGKGRKWSLENAGNCTVSTSILDGAWRRMGYEHSKALSFETSDCFL